MNFKEKLTLSVDQNPNGSYTQDVEGTLLVGDVIFSWDGDYDHYGNHSYTLSPCYHNGEKAFLKSWTWYPADGYSASGEGEGILTFKDGVELLINQGAYKHMFKD